MKLIRLKPLKPFFFGGDINLGREFFGISEYFAQNSQITGAMRFYLANQNFLMRGFKNGIYVPKDKVEEAIELIGDASPNDKGTNRDFFHNDNLGKINFISPMFVLKIENDKVKDALFPTPLALKKEKDYTTYKLKKISSTYYLEGFSYKEIVYQKLGGREFWKKYINAEDINEKDFTEFDEIYKEVEQVGVGLENKKNINEQFYSKISYELRDGYEFGVVIDCDCEIKDGVIQIGADGSMFSLKVDNLIEHPLFDAFRDGAVEGEKLVAISDVLEIDEIKADFRITPIYKKERFNIYKKAGKRYKFEKTKELNLIKRGSVFYNASVNLDNLSAFKKMGYNIFISVKERK